MTAPHLDSTDASCGAAGRRSVFRRTLPYTLLTIVAALSVTASWYIASAGARLADNVMVIVRRILGPHRILQAYVASVVALGLAVALRAAAELPHAPLNWFAALLGIAIVVAGRFSLKVPGHSATVSVSEVFVFGSVLLFGPSLATLVLACDGLVTSLTQKHRRLDRILFNTAEPALSIWTAGTAFFMVAGIAPLAKSTSPTGNLIVPTLALVVVYFLVNSTLTAVAIALEERKSIYRAWRQHALYLALNYYAAASLAALAVNSPSGVNLHVLGLVAPLLVLSYVTYKTWADRVIDAERHADEVNQRFLATIESLAVAVDAKDDVTHAHVRRVQRYAHVVADALGITDPFELKALDTASLLHDVGKVTVSDQILNKPGRLTAREFAEMKLHVESGVRILERVGFPYPVVPMVRHHHEAWNGAGYPDGLSGTRIPLGARILSVVDVFDALTSDRPYRPRLSDADAVAMLCAGRGQQFDPAVVDRFLELLPVLRREEAGDVSRPANRPSPGLAPGVELVASEDDWQIKLLRANAPKVLSMLQRRMPQAEVCIFAADADGGGLVSVQATASLRGTVTRESGRPRYALSSWVVRNRCTIANSEASLDLGDDAVALGLRRVSSLPVFGYGRVVGALSVYLSSVEPLTDDQVETLAVFAHYLVAPEALATSR